METRERLVPLVGACNFRDLGGYPTVDGRATRWDVLFRSDALHELTPTDLAVLSEVGLATVIDLRTAAEVERTGRGLLGHEPVRFLHASILREEAGESTAAPVPSGDDASDRYLWYLDEGGGAFVAALTLVADRSSHPLVFHCTAGKDRTGVLAALVLDILGVEDRVIVDDYLVTQSRMELIMARLRRDPRYGEQIARTPASRLSVNAVTMERFLAVLDERHGGAREWALRAGVAPECLDRMAAQLLEPAGAGKREAGRGTGAALQSGRRIRGADVAPQYRLAGTGMGGSMLDLSGSGIDYVVLGDNAQVLPTLPDQAFQLVYIDPPFNTGKVQRRRTLVTRRSEDGDRSGFGGRGYATAEHGRKAYADRFDDYLGFIGPRLEEARRLLTDDGTLYLHIDYREAHYCKLALDDIFGRRCFLNEVIWAYDYGGRPKQRWPAKHDTILVYVRDPERYFFDQEAVERIPYMAPGLVTPEKAARGKAPTDVWWHTIVPTSGREKTGYPSQKPEGILRRVVQASSAPGGRVLDFFAGSGTTGAVARQLGRPCVMIDDNPEAVAVMRRRLGSRGVRYLDARGVPLPLTDSTPSAPPVAAAPGSGR